MGFTRTLPLVVLASFALGGALRSFAAAPVEIAQAGSDDLLIEESAPPAAGAAAQSAPAGVKAAPADTAKKPAAAAPVKAAASAPAKPAPKKATDARNILVEEGETPLIEEPPAAPVEPSAAAPAPSTPAAAPASAPAAPPKAQPAAPSASAPPVTPAVKTPAPAQPQTEDGGLIEEGGEIVPSPKPATVDDSKARSARASAAVVAESRSINFAENLKEYRSPKLAMLLSLVIPGLGQAYAKRYWKTGLYLAIEAAAIGTSIGFYNKGKKIEKRAYRYADEHYSVDSFAVYYDSLWHAIKDARITDDPTAYADSIFRNDIFLSYDSTFDTAAFRRMYEDRASSSEFYNFIEDNKFVYGWKDAYPSLKGFYDRAVTTSIDTAYASGDTVIMTSYETGDSIDYKYDMYVNDRRVSQKQYGFSQYYTTYKNMLHDRDTQHRVAGNILYLVLLNHIVSAIDAGLTAKAHNDRLLGKESVWRRIRVDPAWVDAGAGAAMGAVVSIDF